MAFNPFKTTSEKPKAVSMPPKTKKQIAWEKKAKEINSRVANRNFRPKWEDIKNA